MNIDGRLRALVDRVLREDRIAEPSGWIQWKGTSVCMDVHCACGRVGHVDDEFCYYYECPHCHAKYAVGASVRLYPLTEREAAVVMDFKTDSGTDDDDD